MACITGTTATLGLTHSAAAPLCAAPPRPLSARWASPPLPPAPHTWSCARPPSSASPAASSEMRAGRMGGVLPRPGACLEQAPLPCNMVSMLPACACCPPSAAQLPSAWCKPEAHAHLAFVGAAGNLHQVVTRCRARHSVLPTNRPEHGSMCTHRAAHPHSCVAAHQAIKLSSSPPPPQAVGHRRVFAYHPDWPSPACKLRTSSGAWQGCRTARSAAAAGPRARARLQASGGRSACMHSEHQVQVT